MTEQEYIARARVKFPHIDFRNPASIASGENKAMRKRYNVGNAGKREAIIGLWNAGKPESVTALKASRIDDILDALDGPKTYSDLCLILPHSRTAIVRTMQDMERANLVRSCRIGVAWFWSKVEK